MPSFTSQCPGTARITPPDKGATLKTPTTTTQVYEIMCPVRQARLKDIVERQRNGTWDGIPRGMSLVFDSDGNGRLNRNTVDERAMKSKDIQKSKEITTLLRLGRPKAMTNKSSSDDEGLGQALEDLLNGEEVNLSSKSNVSPLPSLDGDDNDQNNEVNYSTEEDYLGTFEDGDQTPINQEGAPAMVDENNQSQDARRTTNRSAARH
jgi:hypothetical protein